MQLSPKWASLLVLLLVVALAPLAFPSSFYYRVFALIFINGIAVTGLVILLGYAGQVSLGHAGFAGIGGYATALAPTHLGLSALGALLLGLLLSAAVAWVIGRPILRLKGYYLAVATLGFGILVAMVLTNEAWLTGGPDGISVPDPGLKGLLRDLGIKVKTSVLWYWVSALVLLVGAWLALNLQASPSGRALRALHDSEVAAKTLGVDVARFKLRAFVISAIYASLSGSLLALMNGFVTPEVAGFLHSIELVTMTVLGGAGSVLGGVLGSALLTALPQVLTFFQEYKHLLLGLIMMLVMIFMTEGLVPSLAKRLSRRPS
ncbi:MAG: branched-chain amino acid ABC transporter permease [Rhodospirillales bacterium]